MSRAPLFPPAPPAAPFHVGSTLFTDLLTAAGPDLTLCFATVVASSDVAALRKLSTAVTSAPGTVWKLEKTGATDVREYSAQIRMVLKRR